MTRRTNAAAKRLYLEAKARFAPFAPAFLIRRSHSFDMLSPLVGEPDNKKPPAAGTARGSNFNQEKT